MSLERSMTPRTRSGISGGRPEKSSTLTLSFRHLFLSNLEHHSRSSSSTTMLMMASISVASDCRLLSEFLTPEFQKNLDVAAKITSTWSRLGAAYHAHGEFDKALDMFARSIELAGTDQAKAVAAQEAAAFPDIFAKLQERFPDDTALRLGQAKYLAAQHIAESQFQAAVDVLSGVLADFPNDIELLNQRADAHMKLAQWQAADADYARVLEIEIDDARRRAAERSRAQVQLRLGQFQAGADVYLRETLLSPGDYSRLRDACTTLMLTGQPGIEKVVAGQFYDKFNGTKDASQANWLVRAFTVQPGLVTRANSRKLLELAETAGGTWTAPMTAAIHYRLGDLKQAEPLLTSSKGKPMFEALAAMLLYDQGKTDEARTFLKAGPEAWIVRERTKDRGSAIPAQQSWQEWGVRVAAWREAARKLMGPRITELDQLLANDPDKTAELLERAGLLADAGLYDEALEDLNRLVALNVDSPESLALHGRLLAGLNRDDDALPYLNQAIEGGSQDGGVYAARGAILLRQGHAEPACTDLEKSLELAPTELAARSLSNLLLTEAEQATTWTVLKPTEMKSEGGVTLTLLEDDSVLSSGKHPKRDVYTVTVPLPVRNVTSIALEMLPHPSFVGGSVGRASNGRAAITELEVAGLVQSGEQQTVRLSAAIADFEQQDPGRLWSAASVIDGNTEKPSWGVAPNLREPHRLIVKLDQPTADDTVALRIVIRQNHFHDKLVDGLLLGRFRLLVTDDPLAFEHEKYRYATLKLTDPWARLAGAYLALGNQVALDKLLTRHPAVAVGIADLYAVARDWQRAIAQYSKSITPETIDADLLAKRADAYLASEQWELADADWNRIFELNPSDQSLRQRWVTALTAAKRWPQLGEYYNEVFEGLPEGRASYQPRYKQIETLIRRKDGVFDALRSIRPNDSLLQISLARDAVLRADWDEAVAAYPPGIDDAATPDERYEYAAALLLAGHNDQYREFLHRIVEQENSNAENALDAYSLARMATMSPEENVDWSQVIQWGETAAQEDTGWYTHVAGLAQLRGGHFDEAIQWLDKSVASGWHPELNQLALCLLHAKKGNREKAREYLTKAQEWLNNTESKQVDGYYKVQATDWLEFNVLIQESEALLDGDPE